MKRGDWAGEEGGLGGQLSTRPYMTFEPSEKTRKYPGIPHSYGIRYMNVIG